MRLINVLDGHLEEYFGDDIPPYAIVSHTWEKDEVLFKHMPINDSPASTDTTYSNASAASRVAEDVSSEDTASWFQKFSAFHTPQLRARYGYFKIHKSCEQAFKESIGYVWVDTCSIDKSSSSELSEAINSMFKWYESAIVCYAFLSDMENTDLDQFSSSRWFSRGWTLQELLAPSQINFYDGGWNFLGDKSSLAFMIESATGIEKRIVLDSSSILSVSIACRMSWASKRETTRTEDMAYCLLGIFGVHIPLLYGEGEKAFVRLQEEIIQSSDDQSIFAWGLTSNSGIDRIVDVETNTMEKTIYEDGLFDAGLFANSPQEFRNSYDVISIEGPGTQQPYRMTNRGLEIEMPLIYRQFRERSGDNLGESPLVLGVIACRSHQCRGIECLGIILRKSLGSSTYKRTRVPSGASSIHCDPRLAATSSLSSTIYISQQQPPRRPVFLWSLSYSSLVGRGYKLISCTARDCEGISMDDTLKQTLPVYYHDKTKGHAIRLIFVNKRVGRGIAIHCSGMKNFKRPKIHIKEFCNEDEVPYDEPFSGRPEGIHIESGSGISLEEEPRARNETHFRLEPRCSRESLLGQVVLVVDLYASDKQKIGKARKIVRPTIAPTDNRLSHFLGKLREL